jgi:deoxyribonuclease IV
MEDSFRFGTVGSPKTTPNKPGGSVGAVLRLRELDMGALELGWVQSVRVSEATCALIRQAGAEADVALSVHAPYYINLNADAEEWPKSRQRLMDAAHYGHLAGATDIIFHPGSYFEMSPEEVMPTAIQRLQGCVEDLRAAGNPVVLRPETMGKTAMLGSLEDILQMSAELRSDGVLNVLPCVDFAHLHARTGDGSLNSYSEWARVLERYGNALGQAMLQRMHIHLSGIEYGPKGEKNHLAVLESDMDWEGLFRALKDFDCRGRILCESPEMEADTQVLKEKWLAIQATDG